MKILIADDSKTGLALLAASLENLGHYVIGVSSGAEAIQVFREQRPDLIILDVVMENMDGFACAKKIREIEKDDWIPIIFLSASVDDESISRGINAGGDDYLTKPFSEITLAAKILAMQRISDMRKKLFETMQTLSTLSSTDTLTGIYNRRQFNRTIKEKIASADRLHSMMALLFIDLDHFKNINDRLGHSIGDLLLKEVADRLQRCLRANDFIARLGGDEFAIILENVHNTAEIDQVAKKILHNLIQDYDFENHRVHISCSIGIACYPSEEVDKYSIVQSADCAMYYAKELGRNNYQYFTKELLQRQIKKINLEEDLKYAIDKNELLIDYQPIFDIHTNQLSALEAIVKWNHPKLGLIPADTFIPIAEDTLLIHQIGEWILQSVCLQGGKWHANGFDHFKISVNYSAQQLVNVSKDNILSILENSKFPASKLQFELTETRLSTAEDFEKNIHEIHDMGIDIFLNDFGIGYASLKHLKSLPVSAIKIDKSFIKNVSTNSHDVVIVKSIIALAKNLNIKVIADGIENKEQLMFLIENGCHEGQGNYLSAPLSPVQMEDFLSKESV